MLYSIKFKCDWKDHSNFYSLPSFSPDFLVIELWCLIFYPAIIATFTLMLLKFRGHISILLLALFALPGTIQFIHKLEHDHGDSCHKKEIHFCNDTEQCLICDFSFSAVSVPPRNQPDASITHFHKQVSSIYHFRNDSNSAFHFLLRGPPLS